MLTPDESQSLLHQVIGSVFDNGRILGRADGGVSIPSSSGHWFCPHQTAFGLSAVLRVAIPSLSGHSFPRTQSV